MDIKMYIPQREPFIMVDEVTAASETEFSTVFTVKPDMLFLKDGVLSSSAIIENIAQTCAAGMGYYRIKNNLEHTRLGFIGSINKLTVHSSAVVNDLITTNVAVLHQLENILLIEGTAKVGERILVKGQMKIVI